MIASVLTSACTTRGVVDGTFNTAGFVAKTAVTGAFAAGKLAVNGVHAATSTNELERVSQD